MRKSVKKCEIYPKIKSFMSILCCQKAFEIIQNLQQNFWTGVLNNIKKLHFS